MNYLETQFFRAQSRLTAGSIPKTKKKHSDGRFGYKGTGEDDFYNLPAYLRKRINTYDLDNHVRAVQYADRVRAKIQGGNP